MKSITLVAFIIICSIMHAQDSTNYKNKIGIGVMPIVKYDRYNIGYTSSFYNTNHSIPFISYRFDINKGNIIKGQLGGKYIINNTNNQNGLSVTKSELNINEVRLGYEKWIYASKVWSFYIGSDLFLNNFKSKYSSSYNAPSFGSHQEGTTNISHKGVSALLGISISPIKRLSILIENNIEHSIFQATSKSTAINSNNSTSEVEVSGTKTNFNPGKSVTVTYNF